MSQGNQLQVAYPDDVPRELVADPHRVRQVLLNLMGNALKFTEGGHVTIRVAEETGGEQPRLRVEVIDTGIGIPRDKQADLFQNFIQVDSSTTRRYGGTGLGLAICKRLIGLMGGEIGVESEPGRGSTFWFNLPLVPSLPSTERKEKLLCVF